MLAIRCHHRERIALLKRITPLDIFFSWPKLLNWPKKINLWRKQINSEYFWCWLCSCGIDVWLNQGWMKDYLRTEIYDCGTLKGLFNVNMICPCVQCNVTLPIQLSTSLWWSGFIVYQFQLLPIRCCFQFIKPVGMKCWFEIPKESHTMAIIIYYTYNYNYVLKSVVLWLFCALYYLLFSTSHCGCFVSMFSHFEFLCGASSSAGLCSVALLSKLPIAKWLFYSLLYTHMWNPYCSISWPASFTESPRAHLIESQRLNWGHSEDNPLKHKPWIPGYTEN